jgi:hypothetical protein
MKVANLNHKVGHNGQGGHLRAPSNKNAVKFLHLFTPDHKHYCTVQPTTV